MKSLLIAILATLTFSAFAADNDIKLAVPNDNNGHIVLTLEPCDVKFQGPVPDTLYRAYATQDENTPRQVIYEGCWSAGIPPANEEAQGAIPIVNIYTDDGRVYSQPLKDFKKYKPANQVDI